MRLLLLLLIVLFLLSLFMLGTAAKSSACGKWNEATRQTHTNTNRACFRTHPIRCPRKF